MTAFPLGEVFDDDYHFFYSRRVPPEATEREVVDIVAALRLQPTAKVLDVGCGYGRISNPLAARGFDVVGIDSSEVLLARARADATAAGAGATFISGDARAMVFSSAFDAALSCSTSFGYHSDAENRDVLARICRALAPGGKLYLELIHKDFLLRVLKNQIVMRVGENFLIDENEYQPIDGRVSTQRTIIRGGATRRMRYSVRVFAFPELRDWLTQAGFQDVSPWSRDGKELTLESPRLAVVATAPG